MGAVRDGRRRWGRPLKKSEKFLLTAPTCLYISVDLAAGVG